MRWKIVRRPEPSSPKRPDPVIPGDVYVLLVLAFASILAVSTVATIAVLVS